MTAFFQLENPHSEPAYNNINISRHSITRHSTHDKPLKISWKENRLIQSRCHLGLENLILQQQLSHYEEPDGSVQWEHLVLQPRVLRPAPNSNYELGKYFGACVLDTWFSTPSFEPSACEDADEVFERVAGGPVARAGCVPTLGASTGDSATCTKK